MYIYTCTHLHIYNKSRHSTLRVPLKSGSSSRKPKKQQNNKYTHAKTHESWCSAQVVPLVSGSTGMWVFADS